MVKFNVLFVVLVSFFFGACQYTEPNKEAEQPNIIFVFADDWGYGDLGSNGHPEVKTPNLDKLTAQGTKYTKFHVTSGVCSPSRSSIITGQFPARHRIHGHFAGNEVNQKRGMPNWLPDTLDYYLPQLMQQAGYKTAHFGKWHLGGGGLPHGDPTAPEPKVYGYDETRVWNGNGPTWKGDQHWPTTRYMDDDTLWVQSSSRIVVDETIDFLERNKSGQPFFVNLWLKDPHTPLWPSDEQRALYQGVDPDKETYYAVLTDADFHVGRLMAAVEALGIGKETIIIFSSDNGPAHVLPALTVGKTAGRKGRKVDIFEGGINVPFIVRWPGHVTAGAVDSTSILSGVDILPTFLELAGVSKLPTDYDADGESFASIFDNQKFNRTKPLFWEWKYPVVSSRWNLTERWASRAVIDGKWKMLADNEGKRIELYDLIQDPLEKNDVANENPEKAQVMNDLWENWKKTLPSS
ncbi:sulfatase-like hydrolase/transferase [Reichenbachiella carrageenanivorans]|uniref:Sulfatase-like hydrolase/transferase n=1 Tax=Reichenbachiella carrageenanivorans TaxID=2979869 RepID=A0ABY6D0Z7_9BACT|nr:sulfatase-like hydrolase/transferase [Reichenbachiella carrageenanivorans]UXX79846.1 sulfatase-like hydrolase/transferase [Reichenbachiella carrageenanivorans]